ncbi:BtrH N-terminal domain-containing protein [Paenibacillus illinoisensis]|uniref:BtrH N-terminal domain-containing protein n=1 Tax=Paenibacillus illinoisensis TaxID=59845 RepID=UPI001C8D55E1|nr:BtrH N-terminal domain-containing protein [Paenibacillus illinoisensis]MBY0217734.1 BtrH N-terminal domain-containing protein [Paenibacillus illinoisensis]
MKNNFINITPYNEVFFKNCFYSSLIPVCNYFEISEQSLFLNELIYFTETDGLIDVQYDSLYELKFLLERFGLVVKQKLFSNDIIYELKNSLNEGQPVIIWVDPYFLSSRKDAYKKVHFPHTLLVHGIDSSQGFYVIEHLTKDSLTYKSKIIPDVEIVNSYESYLQMFGNQEIPSMFKFSSCNKVNNYEESSHLEKLLKSYRENQDVILKGLEYLKNFSINTEVRNIESTYDLLLAKLNNIINSKYVDRKRFINLGPSIVFQQKIDESIKTWQSIRASTAKSLYGSKMSLGNLESICELIRGIYEIEYEIYRNLIKL